VGTLQLLGAPLNSSITPGRCDLAPAAIRAALQRYSTYDVNSGRDVRSLSLADVGDLDIGGATAEQAFEPICKAVSMASAYGVVALLGGDNGITRGGVHGLGIELGRCGLVTLDAHFDLRDLDGGLMNGNPVRALLADGLPGANIVQIGIQSFVNSRAYTHVARDAGNHFVTVEEVHENGIRAELEKAFARLAHCDAIYVDLDIDVLDRAFAPGAPGSRPGGLAPWQLRQAAHLCGANQKVRAIDFVEVDPTKDVADVTVLSAAACLLAFASGLLERLEK
jgi:formiminoglutamase